MFVQMVFGWKSLSTLQLTRIPIRRQSSPESINRALLPPSYAKGFVIVQDLLAVKQLQHIAETLCNAGPGGLLGNSDAGAVQS